MKIARHEVPGAPKGPGRGRRASRSVHARRGITRSYVRRTNVCLPWQASRSALFAMLATPEHSFALQFLPGVAHALRHRALLGLRVPASRFALFATHGTPEHSFAWHGRRGLARTSVCISRQHKRTPAKRCPRAS